MTDSLSYARAGVDIDITDAAKREMAKSVDSGDPRVFNRLGAFASLLQGEFPGYDHPILVMKTDEPGSKQKLAFELNKAASIGYDLVNHIVNDVMVMGAQPLYLQDCIVCGTIDKNVVTTLVAAMAEACKEQGCVLCGGETSVQPGVVVEGVYILTATAVGVAEKDKIIDGSAIKEGDVVVAAASNGLHTNGYTLVRKLLEKNPDLGTQKVDGENFIDVIMRPHKCYYKLVCDLFGSDGLHGLAHITGGGIQDNLNRILPKMFDASIDLGLLQVPDIFRVIRGEGNVPDSDMLRTFNMGVGLTLVCSPEAADSVISHIKSKECPAYPIGRIVKGNKMVSYQGSVNW
ncbi:MAG: phosphoribosylformylglycinamidine cyclo-ligase [Deltaproteobacteria bacterium]|nr:phosphoribosylformylglycinamidine cyclo-ligase [Deltaproteobacteria bacterium]